MSRYLAPLALVASFLLAWALSVPFGSTGAEVRATGTRGGASSANGVQDPARRDGLPGPSPTIPVDATLDEAPLDLGDDVVAAQLFARDRLAPELAAARRQATAGDAGAALRAGLILRHCEGAITDDAELRRLAAESVAEGAADPDHLRRHAERCDGVRASEAGEAKRLLEAAAGGGSAEGGYALAGLLAPKTPEHLAWLERAAELGHLRAAQELAREYLEMQPRRSAAAYYWARRAALAGDRSAAAIADGVVGDLPAIERAEIERRVAAVAGHRPG